MKISLNTKFIDGPYGGGMQFAHFLKNYLAHKGHEVINDLKDENIDLILHINPFPFLTPSSSAYSFLDAYKYQRTHPQVVIVERINEGDERKGTHHMNRLLVDASKYSDFVVFIASWLQPVLTKAGLPQNKPSKVILNGADQTLFNDNGKKEWDGKEPLKLVTHHWGNNYNKGHDAYTQLDRLLDKEEFRNLFEFTFIGPIPQGVEYRNTKLIPPLAGEALAQELKTHHIYITASKNEPAGMHHIEGALCGLPLLYINSGALPEYCGGYGLEFNLDNLEEKLKAMREKYPEFREKIKTYDKTAVKMAEEYLKLFEELHMKKEKLTPQPNLIKAFLIGLYAHFYSWRFRLLRKLQII
jgi:hypothetical protein